MQRNEKWGRKIRMNSLLRQKELTAIEKEIAEWFLKERTKFQAAMARKRDKIKGKLDALVLASKDTNITENNNYARGLQYKYAALCRILNIINTDKEKLTELIAQ